MRNEAKALIVFATVLVLAMPSASAWYDSFDYGQMLSPQAGTLSSPTNFTINDPNITGINRIGGNDSYEELGWLTNSSISVLLTTCAYAGAVGEGMFTRDDWQNSGLGSSNVWYGYGACSCNAGTFVLFDLGAVVDIQEMILYMDEGRDFGYFYNTSIDGITYTAHDGRTLAQNQGLTAEGRGILISGAIGTAQHVSRIDHFVRARYVYLIINSTEAGSCDFNARELFIRPTDNSSLFTFGELDEIVMNTTAGNLTVQMVNFTDADPTTNINSSDQRCIIPDLTNGNIYVNYNETCSPVLNFSVYAPWNNPAINNLTAVGTEVTEEDVNTNTSVDITSPATDTYYTDELDLVFTATGLTSTFSINISINGTLILENNSYVNNTETTIDLEGYIGYGTQTIIVTANQSNSINTETVTPYIWRGINATVQEANGTIQSCYNLLVTNGTNITVFVCQNGSTLLEHSGLPEGSVTIDANVTADYDNETRSFTVSNAMDFEDALFTLYPYQRFYARSGSNPIGNLSVIDLSSGDYWNASDSDNATLEISLREITLGIRVWQFIVYGYGRDNETLTYTTSAMYNMTINFSQASLTVNTYDEQSYGGLTFNISITNGTITVNATNQTNPYTALWNALPQGNVTVTISSSGYVPRQYYTVVSPYSVISLSAYLLSTTAGIYETIYVITYQGAGIEDAQITAQKFMGDHYQTVEQERTDASGSATMFLDPYIEYYMRVEAGGYVSVTFDLQPDPISPVVYVRLQATGESGADYVNFSTMFDSISYQFLPLNNYQNDSFTASYEIASSLGDLEYFGWNASYSNGTSICSQVITDQPAGSTITCVVPNISGRYTFNAFFKKADYDEYDFNEFYYFVTNPTGMAGLGIGMTDAISNLGYWLFAIVITLVITGFTSRFLGGYASGWLAVGILAMFVALNPAITIAGISGWYIIAVMILGLLSILVIRAYI